MPAKRKQSRRSPQPTLHPPEQLVEALLARVPFPERVRAAGVCRAWRRHLSQPGLPLWQALNIGHQRDKWASGLDEHGQVDHQNRDGRAEERLELFLPLQRWLWRHGGGLLQVQCSTSFNAAALAEDGMLTAFLHALAATAHSLQALRLDGGGLTNSSLVGVASMGGRLRQLALLGLEHVSDGSLMAALAQLPLLQDLAVTFVDEKVKVAGAALLQDEAPIYEQPDVMRLLSHMAVKLQALRTLAVGYVPVYGVVARAPWDEITRNAQPLPAVMSRLTALSSLMLQGIGWEHAPNGLPHLPQLRRLTLQGGCRRSSMLQPDLSHQLSTLASLETLQVALPRYVGRLPPGLTQLVVSPYEKASMDGDVAPMTVRARIDFFDLHLPALGGLRHLAFHRCKGRVGHGPLLQAVCSAAKALPQLISLHLVNCDMQEVPPELCELSRLQLLNLSNNKGLQFNGCWCLAQAPLHQLASCRWLDLRCDRRLFVRKVSLQLDTAAAIAAMPALEQLALPPNVAVVPPPDELDFALLAMGLIPAPPQQLSLPNAYADSSLGSLDDTEAALLAQHRGPGMPPIKVGVDLPKSDRWAAVYVDLPFGDANEVLGVQLDRSIMRGVPT